MSEITDCASSLKFVYTTPFLSHAELPMCNGSDRSFLGYFSAKECCVDVTATEERSSYTYRGNPFACIGVLQLEMCRFAFCMFANSSCSPRI